ncbi:hypothetical protein PHLCEN_2v2014 [Hermanssonia centrifuga]|uniref:Uncharacterized protein n=1 Tax=Hermanssonia centrifuga TaxID=98765 RepID=A0A2R6RQA8_9APHY|nr:hypothetical protein PHLCEN_2v2014 [Hermanssonia centrifuga]
MGACLLECQRYGHELGVRTSEGNAKSGGYKIGGVSALGNHIALYRHIHRITFEEGSPLYHWDIEKLDRQDDDKARTKMHKGFLLEKSSAYPKARAVRYNHTYMDSCGMDLQVLGRYPTSKEISNIACVAFEEAEALVALLGLVPAQLHRDDPMFVSLPGFDSLLHDGFSTDDKPEEYDDNDPDCAAKLQSLLQEDHWHRGLSDNDDEKLTSLSLAAMSLTIDEMLTV